MRPQCSKYFLCLSIVIMEQFSMCFFPSSVEFGCSCLRMESFGVPYKHIVIVLIELDFVQFPK